MEEYKHHRLLQTHSHEQRISDRIGSDDTLISPSRDVLHVCAANELVTSNGALLTSNAGALLPSIDVVFHVTTVLGGGVSTNSTEGTANRARSAAAARWSKLTGRVVIPSGGGLVFHLSCEPSQDMGWQLSVTIGLRGVVIKLRRVVAIVDHG